MYYYFTRFLSCVEWVQMEMNNEHRIIQTHYTKVIFQNIWIRSIVNILLNTPRLWYVPALFFITNAVSHPVYF